MSYNTYSLLDSVNLISLLYICVIFFLCKSCISYLFLAGLGTECMATGRPTGTLYRAPS